MATELRERLQSTLGDAYTLERELGGGGMSRVFVAREMLLGRQVVVKVLPPDLAAGVNAGRFKREIQVAAQLQHPHIVPVLAAGETEGLPYYTMPYVEGESLRTRLARGGALSITEVVGILRDVAKALAYAHEHGVVHRDIKPDNVMLSGGSAVVADFGIAKAVSASMTDEAAATRGTTLTQVGTTLGTPMYMAPEQAAADPRTDYRADLYAFGCMAYELLAGRPPFFGLTPQKLLAAQMGERPQPVQELRVDTPPLLAELVMRCLEKDADHRPQSAADLVRVLETVTSSGGGAPAMPAVLLAGRGMLRRALAWYAGAFAAVALLARAAVVGIGLPEWVFPGAVVVMLLGLPVILFTAYVHRTAHRVLTTTPTLTPGGTPVPRSTAASIAMKASPHVSFRRAAVGGMIAVGAFSLLVAGYMALRALGIGPAGSLLAAGKLDRNDRILVADFRSPAADTVLGTVVTDALRSELAQSASISVLQPTTVRDVLRRMQRPLNARLDFPLAREVATREGIKAVLDGEVVGLGGGYMLSARLVETQSGNVLASFRETANDQKALIPAIGALSKALRAKIGESLRDVHAAPPLEQVTTPSLDALRKYVQGSRALASEGQFSKAVALLEEAIALDTAFAMAYRRLAVAYQNQGGQEARAADLLQKAYDHRDRLSDAERYLTIGTYYTYGRTPDASKAIAAYEALLDVQPDNPTALNNAAVVLLALRDYAKAEQYAARAVAASPTAAVYFRNLASAQLAQGKAADAQRTLDHFARSLPNHPQAATDRARFEFARGRYDSVVAIAGRLRSAGAGNVVAREQSAFLLGAVALVTGRLADALRSLGEAREAQSSRGVRSATLLGEIEAATVDAWFRGSADAALRAVATALSRQRMEPLPPTERPYAALSRFYSIVGRPSEARQVLAAFQKDEIYGALFLKEVTRHQILADIAMAERRYEDAAREYRAGDVGVCSLCALPHLARAYDLAGNADSALAVFTRYMVTPSLLRVAVDGWFLAGAHKRLGELYEARGDRVRAVEHYAKFVELWKDADAELQPKVAEVRRHLARLSDPEPRP